MNSSNTSLIIQGPVRPNTLKCLQNIIRYANNFSAIIFSTFHEESGLFYAVKSYCENNNVIFLAINPPSIKYTYNYSNIYYQVISTLSACEKLDTEFVIKIRSDETYSNLNKLYDLADEQKINFSNIFFRSLKCVRKFPVAKNILVQQFNEIYDKKYSCYHYHSSDHIICCKSNILQNAYDLCKNICRNIHEIYKFVANIDNTIFNDSYDLLGNRTYNQYSLCPEQLLSLCFLKVIKPDISIDFKNKIQNTELFRKYFHIINIDNLAPYIVSAQNQIVGHIKYSPCYLPSDINTILEYNYE